jgi:protein O-mannosyl-transferase
VGRRSGGAQAASQASARGIRPWLAAACLLAVVLAAYQPAWRGGVLWDDDRHLTRPELRSPAGLLRIWSEPTATQQYYPVVHSAFWLQSALWGEATLGSHLANIALHAATALLAGAILLRLGVPGAWLAAAIFALHPVHVESVAWISELKNTLSGLLFLAAALCYLRFDESRRGRTYALALGLFVLALLSKTVTAMLPPALLIVLWWRRGRIGRNDGIPLLPFFVVGAGFGLMTAWIERTLIGAEGAEFQLSLLERGLLASRAVFFYLAKLLWPARLSFNYPRWEVSARDPSQYLYPLGLLAALAVGWTARSRSRAPLAALLLFVCLLFPALGFFDVYPFRYSFVADHFQYLASLPIVALVAAGLTRLVERRLPTAWRAAGAAALLVATGAPLGARTFVQSRSYADAETLYRATLSENPGSWFARNNLGRLLADRGRLAEAEPQFLEALRLNPSIAEHHVNVGLLRMRQGRLEEATPYLERALSLRPDQAEAHSNLGLLLLRAGRDDDALRHLRQAVTLAPDLAPAHDNLGLALLDRGELDGALLHLERAVRLDPTLADAQANLCRALQQVGRVDEGLVACREAVRLDPASATARYNIGAALQALGRWQEAAQSFTAALGLEPGRAEAHYQIGLCWYRLGRVDDAAGAFEEALRLKPGLAEAHNDLGALLLAKGRLGDALPRFAEAVRLRPSYADAHFNLATTLHRLGRLEEAVRRYEAALALRPRDAVTHNNLGAALQALGRLPEAAAHYREALALDPGSRDARENLSRLQGAPPPAAKS